jgi:serine/threonine protein kinase
MISDDGRPILMDFGSTIKARIHVENRSQALYQQDMAAEQSTMTYRAPELFDVKTGTTLDEKVDIWVCESHYSLDMWLADCMDSRSAAPYLQWHIRIHHLKVLKMSRVAQ